MTIFIETTPKRGALGQEVAAMLRLAWPIILTNMAQTIMTATDVMMLGWHGADSLAAGALGVNFYYALMISGVGVVSAVAPILAKEIGENRFAVRELRRTVRQGLWIAAIICFPIWLVMSNAGPLLLAMGQQPNLAGLAGGYVWYLQFGLLPFYVYIVLRSFISAVERPGWALVVGLLAIAFNALANYGLIFGHFGLPEMGIEGAGLATALSSLFMCAGMILTVMLDRKFRRYQLFGRFWRPDWPRFWQVWKLGIPIGAILLFEVVFFTGAALVMGLIDQPSIAAYQIAIQLGSIAFMVPLGMGQAATVRVGIAYGAGNSEGIRLAGNVAFWLVIAFMSMTAILMFTIPQTLASAFIDMTKPGGAEVMTLAISFLAFAAMFQLFDGAQGVTIGMLRGLQDTKMPMIFAGIGYWLIGMPLGIWLAFWQGWRGTGIWVGLTIGLAVVSVLVIIRWLRRRHLGLEGSVFA
jgi:multidrug resistance protein, MATE family